MLRRGSFNNGFTKRQGEASNNVRAANRNNNNPTNRNNNIGQVRLVQGRGASAGEEENSRPVPGWTSCSVTGSTEDEPAPPYVVGREVEAQGSSPCRKTC